LGRCPNCGKRKPADKKNCDTCRKASRKYQAARKAERLAAGLCPQCPGTKPRKVVPGGKRCKVCRKVNREANKATRDAKQRAAEEAERQRLAAEAEAAKREERRLQLMDRLAGPVDGWFGYGSGGYTAKSKSVVAED
jgi:hypothetical protein